MLRSSAAWALAAAYFAMSWAELALPMALPAYLHDVMHLTIMSNGLVSSLPFMVICLTTPLGGYISDRLSVKIKPLYVRRALVTIGFIPSSILLLLVLAQHDPAAVAALIIAAMGLTGFVNAGYGMNFYDIAPRSSDTLLALTNTLASLAGVAGPYALKAAKVRGHCT